MSSNKSIVVQNVRLVVSHSSFRYSFSIGTPENIFMTWITCIYSNTAYTTWMYKWHRMYITWLFIRYSTYIWLRLFCSAFFRACPGQLLGYAICKEGYPKNQKKKIALVGPAMKEEVRIKKLDFDTKKVRYFHKINMGGTYSTNFWSSLYD